MRMDLQPAWCVIVPLALLCACVAPQRSGRNQAVPTPPAAPAAAVQDPLDSIARCEDLRTDGEGLLQALAARGEERTRTRAVTALGRLSREEHGASVSDALENALEDKSATVRAAAAFALGQRADPETVDALLAAAPDREGDVRARVVEALSRIDDARARRAVLAAQGDTDERVTRMAVLGPHRFPEKTGDANVVDAALVAFLDRAPQAGTVPASTSPEPQTARKSHARALAVFSLMRRKSESARAAFLRSATAEDPEERIFALQGLGAITPDARTLEVLREGLADPDWRVACEAATALGKHGEAASVEGLAQAASRAAPPHAAHHVRAAALDALGRTQSKADVARRALETARSDGSPAVRAAALVAGARLFGEDAVESLRDAARDPDPVVRAGAAAGAAYLPTDVALPLLEHFVKDPVKRVATAAADALAELAADARARELMRSLLGAPDNGLRLSAVTGIAKVADAGDLSALQEALSSTRGEISGEVAAAIIDAGVKIGGHYGFELVTRAATHADPYVARKARAAARKMRPEARIPAVPPASRRSDVLPATSWASNPRVALDTTRGTLVFELYGDEAPFHVTNLIELARAGTYDGTTFHRVVPDFVVQGGDPRGDGNGGESWRGTPLRSEFGPRPYLRGSLGMPRNDDPDSGGGQLFITHRATPHLDGRYTLFGQLVEGFDVLDALQIGDRIERARVLDPRL